MELVELPLAFKALDKVRKVKFKLYFHLRLHCVHNNYLMSILISTPCLFTFRERISIKLCNCGYTNIVLHSELLYSLFLNCRSEVQHCKE